MNRTKKKILESFVDYLCCDSPFVTPGLLRA